MDEKTVHEMNQELFMKRDYKYWDSILPPQRKGDGRYAHLYFDAEMNVIGIKEGFNVYGQRLSDGTH